MIKENYSKEKRKNKKVEHQSDLIIVGGGLAGVCASITAARAGIKVVLVQDRPVLGGNASSEVRLWALGATSHMGNNNRWAREGGVIDEILVENLYRNRDGNPLILDTIILEKVNTEANITLLLNTQVYDLEKDGDSRIRSIRAFCSQNSTEYHLQAPLFCDASGDGIVAFLSGAPFRMGAEKAEEFDEGFAPDVEDYGELLGHSIYFYTKDTGRPVKFVAPGFALKNAGELPRLRSYKITDQGCNMWWVEYGGRLDTIHQSEEIKWELWKVVYGIWDYVKNSGEFPEAKTMTLEWVGTVPGKRESRRFEGDYMLKQADVVQQRHHPDHVAFGGWSLDLHPADGVYSDKMGCNQWHSKGTYGIPYRCYYSRSIENLFLAGRIISASHVAFGSSRVMLTCAHGAQAVGMAATLCTQKQLLPAELYHQNHIAELQQQLSLRGQSIPNVAMQLREDKARTAIITASSACALAEIPFDGPWLSLAEGAAQLLPLPVGKVSRFELLVKTEETTEVSISLCIAERSQNHCPDLTLAEQTFALEEAGEHAINVNFEVEMKREQYALLLIKRNDKASVKGSHYRQTGLLSVFNAGNKAVSNNGKQEPPEGIGVDTFEFWIPKRRPEGHNLGMKISPALTSFQPENVANGFIRPITGSNAWVASPNDQEPELKLQWNTPQTIHEISLFFDPDYDHPMECSNMRHPEAIIPFCIRQYQLLDDSGKVIFEEKENHQAIQKITLEPAITTSTLTVKVTPTEEPVRGGVFGVVVL